MFATMVAFAAAACGGGSSSSSTALVKDVRAYHNGLRWRDFPSAALRVAPSARVDFLDEREQLDGDLRIADWEMTRLEYDDSRRNAQIRVEYTWMLDSRGIVHTTVTRQWWSRHGDRWLLKREIRVRGEPMPGVAEGGKEGTDRRQRKNRVNPGPEAKGGPDTDGPERESSEIE